jgi:hypothetical protein
VVRESRYIVQIGTDKHLPRIEELVSGEELWGGRFRLHISANQNGAARTIYGSSELEVAVHAAEYLIRREQENNPNRTAPKRVTRREPFP